MQETIITVVSLSLIAAITPGPLLTLIISETLSYGKANGVKIALAPLMTDLPIMLVSVFFLSKLAQLNELLGIISLAGAAYLAYLAYGNITTKQVNLKSKTEARSLSKGIIANFLNPNPYIFYFSILGPLSVKAMSLNFLYGPLFLAIFLGLFVAILILIALSVHRAKRLFSSQRYVYVIRVLGLVLLFFAVSFVWESLQLFGVAD